MHTSIINLIYLIISVFSCGLISGSKINNEWESQYDYIIVGGGVAGCVLANRLSEDRHISVLLLEAGGEPTDPFIRIPSAWISVYQNPELGWGYETEPQPKSPTNQRSPWPLGKVLGGSGSLNAVVYTRGVAHDFDRWAELGNYNWSYEAVLPYFKKSEHMTDPVLSANGNHGTDGLMETRVGENVPIVDAFIKAGQELGLNYNEDNNGPTNEGIGLTQQNVNRRGERMLAYEAFLEPVRARQNLHVITEAHVTKIAFSKSEADIPHSEGVYFKKNDETYFVKVKREVIVSGGPVGSPAVLMHSGIGPREHLESLGIDVISDLAVGENTESHVVSSLQFLLNQTTPIAIKKMFTFEAMFNQLFTGKGPWAGDRSAMAFYKSETQPDKDMFPYIENNIYKSALALPTQITRSVRNDKEITPELFKRLIDIESGPESFVIETLLLHPRNKGKITLRSTDPLDKPIINDAHLSHPDDVKDMIQGIRNVQRLASTSVMRNAQVQPITRSDPNCRNHVFDTDAYWECYIYNFFYVYHISSSCRMSPDRTTGVVDDRLRVYGVSGLRVADSSIMPHITSGHTAAPTVMIAEKAADMIKMDWYGRTQPPTSAGNSLSTTPLIMTSVFIIYLFFY